MPSSKASFATEPEPPGIGGWRKTLVLDSAYPITQRTDLEFDRITGKALLTAVSRLCDRSYLCQKIGGNIDNRMWALTSSGFAATPSKDGATARSTEAGSRDVRRGGADQIAVRLRLRIRTARDRRRVRGPAERRY